MKIKDFVVLLITVAIATLWIWIVQPYLFGSVIPFSMTNNDLQDWLGAVFFPTTWILYGSGIFVTLIWLAKATKTRSIHAKQTLSHQGLWWLLLLFYGLFNLIAFFTISFFSGWLDDNRSLEPLFITPLFILFDLLILYWLPTALATPRSLRYVPPLAMTLRKLYGG